MRKRIKKGQFKGLTEITEEMLEQQEEKAKAAATIPVKEYRKEKGKLITSGFCMQGDLDRCPVRCGACLHVPEPWLLKGTRIIYGTHLDMSRYQAQCN